MEQDKLINLVLNNLQNPRRLILYTDGSFLFEDLEKGVVEPEFTLFTSGTTGEPKPYTHSLCKLRSGLKVGSEYERFVWGLLYPVNHLAGLLVVLQALLNECEIINLFGLDISSQLNRIREKKVTHLSGTPTLFRQWLSLVTLPNKIIKQITLGGEPVDGNLIDSLKRKFPQARITNIYALTEGGTVLKSNSEWFEIKEENKDKIQIRENEIYILTPRTQRSQSGDGLFLGTGDKVEFHAKDPNRFRIVGRDGNGVNIGGFWVNPEGVESKVRRCEWVSDVVVGSRKNSVLGTVLTAQVIFKKDTDQQALYKWMQSNLQPYEIPKWVEVVKELKKTRTGKAKRKD